MQTNYTLSSLWNKVNYLLQAWYLRLVISRGLVFGLIVVACVVAPLLSTGGVVHPDICNPVCL